MVAAPYIYNAVSWTADKLITDIKRKCSLPASSDYDNDTILEVANQAIWSTLSNSALTNDGGFWGHTFTHRITGLADTVSNGLAAPSPDNRPGSIQGDGLEYELPPAVAAGAIKFVTYKDASGNEVELSHIPFTDFFRLAIGEQSSGTPWAYTLWENKLHLLPAASSSLTGTIQIRYTRRHPQVMQFSGNFKYVASVCPVLNEGVDPNTGTITCDTDNPNPSWWPANGSYSVGYEPDGYAAAVPFRWDVISSIGPHSHRVVDMDYFFVSADNGTNTYGVAVDKRMGDLEKIFPRPTTSEDDTPYYPDDDLPPIGTFVLAAAGTSPYVHLTHELREAASMQAAAVILRNIGSIEEAAAYDNKVERLALGIQNQMAPRVKNSSLKVKNHSSLMSRASTWWKGR